MTSLDWLGVVVAICSVVGAIAATTRFMVKHYLVELKPNSGSSIKDRVGEIERKIDKLEDRVDQIYSLLIDKRRR